MTGRNNNYEESVSPGEDAGDRLRGTFNFVISAIVFTRLTVEYDCQTVYCHLLRDEAFALHRYSFTAGRRAKITITNQFNDADRRQVEYEPTECTQACQKLGSSDAVQGACSRCGT